MSRGWRIFLWILGGLALIGLIVSDLFFHWTALSRFTLPRTPVQVYKGEKTIWDWLDLLVVPTAIALSVAILGWMGRKNEQAIADERAQDEALEAYIEQMCTLLLDKCLRESTPKSVERDIARAWTLTILRRLKGERKAVLLHFLYESGLIMQENSIVSLSGADLRGAFQVGAHLWKANLTRADLTGAHLEGAHLKEVDLTGADLTGAHLTGADLWDAHLEGANLTGTHLESAYLRAAHLKGADLTGAHLTGADLSNCKYDKNTRWPEGFDPEQAGAVLVQ